MGFIYLLLSLSPLPGFSQDLKSASAADMTLAEGLYQEVKALVTTTVEDAAAQTRAAAALKLKAMEIRKKLVESKASPEALARYNQAIFGSALLGIEETSGINEFRDALSRDEAISLFVVSSESSEFYQALLNAFLHIKAAHDHTSSQYSREHHARVPHGAKSAEEAQQLSSETIEDLSGYLTASYSAIKAIDAKTDWQIKTKNLATFFHNRVVIECSYPHQIQHGFWFPDFTRVPLELILKFGIEEGENAEQLREVREAYLKALPDSAQGIQPVRALDAYVLPGDLNGDSTLDSRDVELGFDYHWNFATLTDRQLSAFDLNRDGIANVEDLIQLEKRVEQPALWKMKKVDPQSTVVGKPQVLEVYQTPEAAIEAWINDIRLNKSVKRRTSLTERALRGVQGAETHGVITPEAANAFRQKIGEIK